MLLFDIVVGGKIDSIFVWYGLLMYVLMSFFVEVDIVGGKKLN